MTPPEELGKELWRRKAELKHLRGGFNEVKAEMGVSNSVAHRAMTLVKDDPEVVVLIEQVEEDKEARRNSRVKACSPSTRGKRKLPEVTERIAREHVRGKGWQLTTEFVRVDGKKLTERQDKLLREEALERAERTKDWPVSNERIAEIARKAQEEVRAEWSVERMWTGIFTDVMEIASHKMCASTVPHDEPAPYPSPL